MKKLPVLLAALIALLAVLSACAPGAAKPAASTPAVTAPAPTGTPAAEKTPAVTPDMSEVGADMEAMMPILDSIVGTMGINDTTPYAPGDPAFVWNVLYLMGVNWRDTHPLVEQTDECIIVKRQVMQEFASAAFLDYNDLPALPENMKDAVQYDEGLDAYKLAYSDRGNTETRMGAIDVAKDGTVTVTVELYELPDTLLGALAFTLVPNPYVDGITDPIYLYSVSAVELA